jgi:hypothetical protein
MHKKARLPPPYIGFAWRFLCGRAGRLAARNGAHFAAGSPFALVRLIARSKVPHGFVSRSARAVVLAGAGMMALGVWMTYCPGRQGRLSALSVFLCKPVLYGAFVWAHRALNHQKWRFPARAVSIYIMPHGRRRRGHCATLLPPISFVWAAELFGFVSVGPCGDSPYTKFSTSKRERGEV